MADAANLPWLGFTADVVVNCSGLGASKLAGVLDATVIPARGQIVHVRNEAGKMITVSGTDEAEDEVMYLMQRAAGKSTSASSRSNRLIRSMAGGGTVLGGSYQKGNWESQPDPNLATRIMKRCVELCPELTGGKGIEGLDIIRHWVGLRPLRSDGVRLEKEEIDGVWVVHNYGHGGFGYQSSYGCAMAAVRLVEDAIARAGERKT